MSEASNHHFSGIVTGKITRDASKQLQMHLSDGSFVRVGGTIDQKSWDVRQWQVLPSTASTGEVTRLQILAASDTEATDGFHLVGQVLQVAKKKKTALIEIQGDDGSALRLTFSGFPENLTDQVELTAHLVDGRLQVVTAIDRNQPEQSSVKNQRESLTAAIISGTDLTKPSSPKKPVRSLDAEKNERLSQDLSEIALAALAQETALENWRLSTPTVRGRRWEWVATQDDLMARVMVNSLTKEAEVSYQVAIATIASDISIEQQARLNVTPLGAARSIGASCFRVEIGPYEVILDAGTRPKGSQPLPEFDRIQNPNLILITHAHQDHIGALPVFHRRFGATPMICSFGTKEIAEVMLTDCLKVQEQSEDFASLFDENDLYATLFHLQTQAVSEDFYPLPGLKVRFIPAGHIVGAVCIYLEYGDRSLLYTGDYNTTSSRTTDGLQLSDLPQAEMLITESTYGSDVHPSRRSQESELLQAIAEVVQAGGNVLIPAFALGRAQEIILAIRTSALFHSLKIPVFVDGLVRPVTNVFQDNLDLLPKAVANFAKTGRKDPFFDATATPPIICIETPRDRPLAISKPSVIIASSGMMSGGASVYYGKILLERENAAVFISGYTDEESPGRLLQGLEPGTEIELDGTKLTVRSQIRKFNLSAHADRVGLTQVIHRVAPKHLILVHGSPYALKQLSNAGDLRDRYWIHIPKVGDTITFGVPPEHLSMQQLARVDAVQEFEVEVTAEYDGMWLRVPEYVLTDPRWQGLTNTGTLQAQWSKKGVLELRRASAIVSDLDEALIAGKDCCAVCLSFNGSTCRAIESPLYGKNVDPLGKCQEFQMRFEAPSPAEIATDDVEDSDELEDQDG
jgi:Cft2 family RNA processing exonuclease